MTSFLKFCEDKRRTYIPADTPKKKHLSLKDLGHMWSALDEKQKKQYQLAYLQDSSRYETEKGAWLTKRSGTR